MRKIFAGVLIFFSVFMIPVAASAHVVVKPSQVNVGEFQTFTTSVPNEKNSAVISLRLVIPSGIKEVTPTVKQGWNITTKKSNDNVTEIIWAGSTIPIGMRDDFTFSAQAPAASTTLVWKAYQTYADGTVVSWDQAPTSTNKDDDSSNKGPYSTIAVINDLTDSNNNTKDTSQHDQAGAYIISGIALLVAIITLATRRKS